jgi:calcineurin-like phosphoesterase family protein
MREGTEPPGDDELTDDPPPGEPRTEVPADSRVAVEPPAVEPSVVEPVPSASGPGDDMVRSIALGLVAFAATLILLAGFSTLLTRSGDSGSGPAATAPSSLVPGSTSPSAVPSSSAGTVPTAAPGDPVLVGAGDIADCTLGGDAQTESLLATIPGTVFTAGDNAYPNGTAEQFQDCYGPTWGRQLARTRPAAGNHDWETKDLAGYYGYFGTGAHPAGKSWYSYDLGAWHVIVLDSDCDQVGGCAAGSEQGKWLAADLAASKARCTMAIWHHPRFSSGEHGDIATVAPFWRVLYDAGADVVVDGHDHDYERFAPQDPNGRADDARGLREFVVGTGGAELRPFLAPRPNSVVRAAGSYGVIRFVLHPTGYEWHFITTDGQFGDSGAGTCH